jgi:hypothetical protein
MPGARRATVEEADDFGNPTCLVEKGALIRTDERRYARYRLAVGVVADEAQLSWGERTGRLQAAERKSRRSCAFRLTVDIE